MADAIPINHEPPATIVSIDVVTMQTDPPLPAVIVGGVTLAPARPEGRVFYRLRVVWSNGRVEYKESSVAGVDFAACESSFLQANPKRKFLQSLVTLGYEKNLTPL